LLSSGVDFSAGSVGRLAVEVSAGVRATAGGWREEISQVRVRGNLLGISGGGVLLVSSFFGGGCSALDASS
jgi:hypothetical protein